MLSIEVASPRSAADPPEIEFSKKKIADGAIELTNARLRPPEVGDNSDAQLELSSGLSWCSMFFRWPRKDSKK